MMQDTKPDLARVKANIATMIEQDAPEEDIDAYVASEGLTPEALQTGAPMAATDYTQQARPGVGPMQADEQVVFGDQQGPKSAPALSADQQAQVSRLVLGGDLAGARDLSLQLSGGRFAPSMQSLQQVAEYAKSHPGWSPPWDNSLVDQAAEDAYNQEIYRGFDKKPIEELRGDNVLPEEADAFARGAAIGLDDEIDALQHTLFQGGSWEDNLSRAKAIKRYDEENHPYLRTAGAVAGSLLLPTKALGIARPAATAAYREARLAGAGATEARALAEAAAQRSVQGQLATEGAVYGGGIGAAEGDNLQERLSGGVGGAAIGAGVGAALPTVGRVLADSHAANLGAPVARELTESQQVGQAAARQGIEVLPADVGGPVTRRATSMAAQTIAGGQPIIEGGKRVASQVENRRNELAQSIGNIFESEAAGQEAILGAKAARESTRLDAKSYYGPAEAMTKDFKAVPDKAIAKLDEHIAELRETPGEEEGLAVLEKIRDDLSSGKTTVRGIRGMRTRMRDKFTSLGLRGSDIERRAGEVVDAAADDISDSLNNAGLGEAANLFAQGDAKWKARVDLIDNVFEPIIGTRANPKSGEQVIKALKAAMQNNGARAVRFLNALPAEEQGNVRASIIGSMGKKGDNADFSLDTFLRNWENVGDTSARAYFGPESRAALDDLALVAKGSKQAMGYANRSNTGGVVGNLGTLATGVAGLPWFIGSVAGQYGLGRLLASPRFARWLARAPKTTLNDEAYLDRLSRIARAEPAIANEVLGLQQRLRDAFTSGGTARLAAEESGDEGPRITGEQQGQQNGVEQ